MIGHMRHSLDNIVAFEFDDPIKEAGGISRRFQAGHHHAVPLLTPDETETGLGHNAKR